MKKLLLIILGSFMTFGALAQENEECSKVQTEIGLESQRIHRGVGYANAPSIGGKISYRFCDWFTLSSQGIAATTTHDGLTSSLENVATVNKGEFSLSLGDIYFFYGGSGADNDYFDYGKETRHLLNTTVKYTKKEGKKSLYYGLVQTTVYKSETDDNNGVYFEGGYNITKNLQFTAGYVTDASTMNFRSKGGITHVGFNTANEVKISSTFKPKVITGIYFNPSYKDVFDVKGLNNNPVQFSVGVLF